MTSTDTPEPWVEILSTLRTRLHPAGFDLIQPFPVARYNRSLSGKSTLPTFSHPSALGIVIGNSKHLWTPFISYLAADPDARLEATDHPLNDYAKVTIQEALEGCPEWEMRFPDDKGEKFVHFQPLAHLSGLAYFNRVS